MPRIPCQTTTSCTRIRCPAMHARPPHTPPVLAMCCLSTYSIGAPVYGSVRVKPALSSIHSTCRKRATGRFCPWWGRSIRRLLEDLLEGGVALAEGKQQGGVELRLVGVQEQAADGGVCQAGLV